MVTRVRGQNYSPDYDGDPNALFPCNAIIEGTGDYNTTRQINLDGLGAVVDIYNHEEYGAYFLRGGAASTIEAKLDGKPISETRGRFVEGQIFSARVKGKGHVEAEWTRPNLPSNARR